MVSALGKKFADWSRNIGVLYNVKDISVITKPDTCVSN